MRNKVKKLYKLIVRVSLKFLNQNMKTKNKLKKQGKKVGLKIVGRQRRDTLQGELLCSSDLSRLGRNCKLQSLIKTNDFLKTL